MNKMLVIILIMASMLEARAQHKRWEHNIYISGGLMIYRVNGVTTLGLSDKYGYGLNYYLSDHWSVMPAVEIREESEAAFTGVEGGDYSDFTFVDIPVTAQYHVSGKAKGWILALGPVWSICTENSSYYVDADPLDPFNGRKKIKKTSFGLRPGIFYQTKRLRFGTEATISLLNQAIQYPERKLSQRVHNVVGTIGIRF